MIWSSSSQALWCKASEFQISSAQAETRRETHPLAPPPPSSPQLYGQLGVLTPVFRMEQNLLSQLLGDSFESSERETKKLKNEIEYLLFSRLFRDLETSLGGKTN